jgi:hypothetical protein
MGAIYRDDLLFKMNGGFHEEYKNGICYDDNDFIKYLIHNNFVFKIPDFTIHRPFCIHQYHEKTASLNFPEYHLKNGLVYEKRMNAINASLFCDIFTGFMPVPIIL